MVVVRTIAQMKSARLKFILFSLFVQSGKVLVSPERGELNRFVETGYVATCAALVNRQGNFVKLCADREPNVKKYF
jgi:hypothetical protein